MDVREKTDPVLANLLTAAPEVDERRKMERKMARIEYPAEIPDQMAAVGR